MAIFDLGTGSITIHKPSIDVNHVLKVEEDFGGSATLKLPNEQLITLVRGLVAYVRTQGLDI